MGEHAYFEAGSASTSRNEYKNFNGQLKSVRLSFGMNSYISDIHVLRGYVTEHFPVPERPEI
jgi:hypothetical protein